MQLTFEGKTIDQLAIELIQAYEQPEGYYLGFSGGKDSVVIYDLAKRAGVKFQPTYNVSPIDPPQIKTFINANYPDVVWENNAKGFYSHYFMQKGAPLRQQRWCCSIIKEAGGKGRVKILGMRAAESGKRSHYNCFMPKIKGQSKVSWVLPILQWSDADVWQYVAEHNISVCDLYQHGFKRIGCILCPFSSKEEIKYSFEAFPNIVNAWRQSCIHYAEKKITEGKPSFYWKSGEEYFNWWVKR